jgi:hypothetical protein
MTHGLNIIFLEQQKYEQCALACKAGGGEMRERMFFLTL